MVKYIKFIIKGMTLLGMFFETKYGKIYYYAKKYNVRLGMFFETKYGKIMA